MGQPRKPNSRTLQSQVLRARYEGLAVLELKIVVGRRTFREWVEPVLHDLLKKDASNTHEEIEKLIPTENVMAINDNKWQCTIARFFGDTLG